MGPTPGRRYSGRLGRPHPTPRDSCSHPARPKAVLPFGPRSVSWLRCSVLGRSHLTPRIVFMRSEHFWLRVRFLAAELLKTPSA